MNCTFPNLPVSPQSSVVSVVRYVWLGKKGNQVALSIDLLNTIVSTFLGPALYSRACPKRLFFIKLKYCRKRFEIINGAQKGDPCHNGHLRTTDEQWSKK